LILLQEVVAYYEKVASPFKTVFQRTFKGIVARLIRVQDKQSVRRLTLKIPFHSCTGMPKAIR